MTTETLLGCEYRDAVDFGELVTSEQELRDVVPAPREGAPALRKQIDHLDEHCREFIARSPFLVLATAGADGTCDTSPRGGPPGFARVLDERRLLVPEYPGNRRADSHRNLLENPRASLIFVIPAFARRCEWPAVPASRGTPACWPTSR